MYNSGDLENGRRDDCDATVTRRKLHGDDGTVFYEAWLASPDVAHLQRGEMLRGEELSDEDGVANDDDVALRLVQIFEEHLEPRPSRELGRRLPERPPAAPDA